MLLSELYDPCGLQPGRGQEGTAFISGDRVEAEPLAASLLLDLFLLLPDDVYLMNGFLRLALVIMSQPCVCVCVWLNYFVLSSGKSWLSEAQHLDHRRCSGCDGGRGTTRVSEFFFFFFVIFGGLCGAPGPGIRLESQSHLSCS